MQNLKNQELIVSEDEKFEHYKYSLQILVPILKRLNEEQMIEKEMEAKRQGIFFQFLSHKFRNTSIMLFIYLFLFGLEDVS